MGDRSSQQLYRVTYAPKRTPLRTVARLVHTEVMGANTSEEALEDELAGFDPDGLDEVGLDEEPEFDEEPALAALDAALLER